MPDRAWRRRFAIAAIAMAAGCAAFAQPEPVPPAPGRAASASAGHAVAGSLEALVRDAQAFDAFAVGVRADIESQLAGAAGSDPAQRREALGTLLQLDVLARRDADALARIEAIRALQDDPAQRALTGLQARAFVEARQTAGSDDPAALRAPLRARLDAALAALPAGVADDAVREARRAAERLDEPALLGRLRALQPAVDRSGRLARELAPVVVNARYGLVTRLPLKAPLVEAYAAWLAAHRGSGPDIWAARAAPPEPAAPGRAAVVLAVWDSGVDLAAFDAAQLLREPSGRPAVIAFDHRADASPRALEPLPEPLRTRRPELIARVKGWTDRLYGFDSPEADALQAVLAPLDAQARRAAVAEILETAAHVHGTHVAGLALAGNPHARLLVARMGVSPELPPQPCPTLAQARKDADAIARTIAFIGRHGARVANLSWGVSVQGIEAELAECAPDGDIAAHRALARSIYRVVREAFATGFARTPRTLWIAAADNGQADASTDHAPADIALPNVLVVGAVDRAGRDARFTPSGATVAIYANGEALDSVVPGGGRVALSGTSMAAPQVANLAARLVAARPGLTPPEVVAAIVGSAQPGPHGPRPLLHPARALQAVQQLAR